MSVKIRLARGGRKKVARFRLVAADSRFPRDGRFLETLGYYNPQAQPKELKINVSRIGHWIESGAEISDTVQSLLQSERFYEKWQAVKKGTAEEALNVAPKQEKVRKKIIKNKKA